MMMDFQDLVRKYKVDVKGVLHVGAHLAEEAEVYESVNSGTVWWVEANPSVLPKIEQKISRFRDQWLIHALVYSEDGAELEFNVTNYDGMSSSIYEFGTHTSFSPDVLFTDKIKLTTKTLDTICKANNITANFLNMDLQGAEGPALRGAESLINRLDYIMTEVNKDEVYVGCTRIEEIDKILEDFQRVETLWVSTQGWGDAFYIRKTVLNG